MFSSTAQSPQKIRITKKIIDYYLFKQNSKNMKKLKFLSVLLVLGSISALNSCKKEVEQTNDSTNVAAISSITSDELVTSGTQFGAGLDGSTDERVTICNKF